MGEKVKGAIHSAYIHQVEKRQHEPDTLEEVAGAGIPVFDDNGYGSEYAINNKKVHAAGEETLDKTGKRSKNTSTENQQVHEQDVGGHDPCKNHGLFTTIALYRHGAKVGYSPLQKLPRRDEMDFGRMN